MSGSDGRETERGFKDFDTSLEESGHFPLRADGVEVLQVNLGRLCNQACAHCHIEATPDSSETMDAETVDACIAALAGSDIPTIDLTGGAPELNPHFRRLVEESVKLGRHVMVRCNLTVFFEPGNEDLPRFYADCGVEVIASMPCYTRENVDAQRGEGVFEKSIKALKLLNDVGYGKPGTGLILNLVYNPGGASLPGSQSELEADYKRELGDGYGVVFNNLFTITNMPIGRFREYLGRSDAYDNYMAELIDGYNPAAAGAVMCRNTVSVGWRGGLYDCDFNQMLALKCGDGAPTDIRDFDVERLRSRKLVTGLHCYGCTTGAGSSCGGAVVDTS
jgi:radical SAM/Cys-rich protein